jgi:hypothetical protein
MRLRFHAAQDCRARELLAALEQEAGAAGATTVDSAAAPEPGDVPVFVPEPLGPPPPGDLGRSIAICASHPGGSEFDCETELARHAGAAFHLTPAGALEQRRRGVASSHLRLGMARRWLAGAPARPSSRGRGAALLAVRSRRVEQIVAAAAPALAATRAVVRLRRPGQPVAEEWARTRRAMLEQASVVLDVHPFRPHGIDWVMALEALGAGAVPVFEHVVDSGPLEPGVHARFAHGSQLGIVAGALLADPERLDRMSSDGRALALAELPMGPAIDGLLASAEGLHGRRARRRDRPAVARERRERPRVVSVDESAVERKRAAMARIEGERASQQRTLDANGAAPELEPIRDTPAWAETRGDVAVCVPCHEDGVLALRALESVAASRGVVAELLVLDDGSSDDSCDIVGGWLSAHPEIPARLLRRHVNRGTGAARNAMLEQARAPLAFMLDADNAVFPWGLATLAERLSAAPPGTALAYGLIERHRDGESLGLLSADPWDPRRFRDGNYIDAMALLRRDAVLGLGGYTDDIRLYGWEDFDLWCRVAESGLRGELVTEIVGRYNERPRSMRSISDIDCRDAVTVLRERYPNVRPGIPGCAVAVAS